LLRAGGVVLAKAGLTSPTVGERALPASQQIGNLGTWEVSRGAPKYLIVWDVIYLEFAYFKY
jgi:hypothetical protein